VSQATATQYPGYVLWSSPVRSRNAPEFAEVFKSPAQAEPSTPPPQAPDPALATAQAPLQVRPAATPAPTPKPAPVPPPGSGGNGLAAIYAVFGNSPGLTWALRVANCESHYNPLAINRSSGASGLFQFMPATWNANFPGQNIWDPMAQAHAALVFYNAGRQSAWTCK
jgi:soluble lytic murein transglycosylase-like protein